MGRKTEAADRTVKDIRRQTRNRYSSEEKIRIVLAGLRGEDSIAELCRQEGIAQGNNGPAPDLFRVLDYIFCHQGERSWDTNTVMSSDERRFVLR